MKPMTNSWCRVCMLPALSVENSELRTYRVECPRCGEYTSFLDPRDLLNLSPEEVANASGYISENQGFVLRGSEEVDFLRSFKTPTVGQKAEKLLLRLTKQHLLAGTKIVVPANIDQWIAKYRVKPQQARLGATSVTMSDAKAMLYMLGYAWAQNEAELDYLIFSYLVEGVGYLDGQHAEIVAGGINSAFVVVSPSGWEFIQSKPQTESSTAFVAMWFNAEVDELWSKAIYPAVESSGYMPFRIDKKEHNNKIDDEIIAAIRGCHFLIADFTGQRGGVYYEAGFASGLGKPVIWTVRKDSLKDVHFDTRQFNHIPWEADKLDAFRDALKNRILATIGKGPN